MRTSLSMLHRTAAIIAFALIFVILHQQRFSRAVRQ